MDELIKEVSFIFILYVNEIKKRKQEYFDIKILEHQTRKD
jgi:hypothetical protein